MKRSYAKGTSVPTSRTKGHIEDLLVKYQATTIGVISETTPPRATVAFQIQKWSVRMRVPLPTEKELLEQAKRERYIRNRGEWVQRRIEQIARERWRALFLTLKAKLVSVETEVETFEEAFLPHLVLQGGRTVYDTIQGQLTNGHPLQLQLQSGT